MFTVVAGVGHGDANGEEGLDGRPENWKVR